MMASKGQSSMGQDQDDTIFVLYTTVMKKLQGQQNINNITVSAASSRADSGCRRIDPSDAPHSA